jgi:hypothetical protein
VSASSLSPETLELVARGLGGRRIEAIAPNHWYFWPDDSTSAYAAISWSAADLAAACKAKLRERGLGYDCWANTSGYLGARIYKNGDVPYIYQPSQDGTDDEALISCFAQAVAKGALP